MQLVLFWLQITGNLNWFVRMTSELESKIVCVERVKEYSEKPVEVSFRLVHSLDQYLC
jgi:hypothetical protein